MTTSEPNGLKIVVDYVTQIRGQDMVQFQTLLTIFIGSVFGAILVASLANSRKESPTTKGRAIGSTVFGVIALLFFLGFVYGLRFKFGIRREFCHKWMSNMITRVTSDMTILELIKDFSTQRYALCCLEPNDPNFVFQDKNMPVVTLFGKNIGEWIRRNGWTFDFCAVLAAIAFFIAMCISGWPSKTTYKPTKEIKITSPCPDASIKAEGTLTIQ